MRLPPIPPIWPGFLALLIVASSATAATAQPANEDLSPSDLRLLADREPPEELTPLGATPCVGGMAGTYPCDRVDLAALIPLSTFGASNANDVWGWTDEGTGKEYAILGLNNGTAFVEITDPANPIYLGKLPTHSGTSLWRSIKVYADHAFIGSEAVDHGLQVFHLEELRNVVNPPVTFSESGHYNGYGRSHTTNMNEETGFLYAAGSRQGTNTCNTGLHIVDVSVPDVPVFAGCVGSDGYTHETQCVVYHGPDATYQGREICLNSNEDTLTIVDNQYVKGNFVYQANYRAGLRILSLDNIAAGTLTPVAFFDVYPSSNGASFNGSWSVFPYFDSGTVVVGGIEQGLFVLRPRRTVHDPRRGADHARFLRHDGLRQRGLLLPRHGG